MTNPWKPCGDWLRGQATRINPIGYLVERYQFSRGAALLVIVLGLMQVGLIAAQGVATTRTLVPPPPLTYSASEYTLACDTGVACNLVAPGQTIRWSSELHVPERVTLRTNYSIWNETCKRPYVVARDETAVEVNLFVPIFIARNKYIVPDDIPPGDYRLTRFTEGRFTGEAFYDVFFTVGGLVGPCA